MQSEVAVDKSKFLDIESARKFIEQAMKHYLAEKASGWFTDWLNDLYIKLGENCQEVTLDEMLNLQSLHCDGQWKPQTFAQNAIYKLFDRLGRDTSGIIGY